MTPRELVQASARKKLAKKLHTLCRVEEPLETEEDSKIDLLFHCCTNLLPFSSLNARIGFHLIDARRPRFSSFLTHPDKSTEILESGLKEADEIYSGNGMISAAVFDIDGKLFVYSNVEPQFSWTQPYVQVKNHNRPRRIYELKRFLSAINLAQLEEEQ